MSGMRNSPRRLSGSKRDRCDTSSHRAPATTKKKKTTTTTTTVTSLESNCNENSCEYANSSVTSVHTPSSSKKKHRTLFSPKNSPSAASKKVIHLFSPTRNNKLFSPTKSWTSKKSSNRGPVFEAPIESVMAAQALHYPHLMIPVFVDRAMAFIVQHGWSIDGIFRISGRQADIDSLRHTIDTRSPADWSLPDQNNDSAHVIAGTLKLFFRLLPVKLLCFEEAEFKHFESLSDDEKPSYLKCLVASLPVVHQHVLDRLTKMLGLVAESSEDNRMGLENLATLFSPNLICRTVTDPFAMMAHVQPNVELTTCLIEHRDLIFDGFCGTTCSWSSSSTTASAAASSSSSFSTTTSTTTTTSSPSSPSFSSSSSSSSSCSSSASSSSVTTSSSTTSTAALDDSFGVIVSDDDDDDYDDDGGDDDATAPAIAPAPSAPAAAVADDDDDGDDDGDDDDDADDDDDDDDNDSDDDDVDDANATNISFIAGTPIRRGAPFSPLSPATAAASAVTDPRTGASPNYNGLNVTTRRRRRGHTPQTKKSRSFTDLLSAHSTSCPNTPL